MATEPTLIQSVVRALTLLDAVGAATTPVPAKKLAHLTGLPLATTYHLLRTLVHEGYLTRTDAGYALGDRVDALAGARPPLPRHAHRVLRQLHADAGAAAYLSILDDGEIRLMDIVDSSTAPRADLWVGFHDAAHATALGKAVLSRLPEPARRDYVESHPLVELTARTLTSRRVLLRQLATSPELAVDRQEYAVGTVCLATPVPSTAVSAAVAISGPADRAGALWSRRAALRRAARLLALDGAG